MSEHWLCVPTGYDTFVNIVNTTETNELQHIDFLYTDMLGEKHPFNAVASLVNEKNIEYLTLRFFEKPVSWKVLEGRVVDLFFRGLYGISEETPIEKVDSLIYRAAIQKAEYSSSDKNLSTQPFAKFKWLKYFLNIFS